MKFTKRARTIAEIIYLSFGGSVRGASLSCLYAPLTQTQYSAFCPLADINKKTSAFRSAPKGGLPLNLSISINPPAGGATFSKKICTFLNYSYICIRNQYLKVMARYIYKSTRNYNIGFEWVSTSFDLDYVHFRFTIETYRGISKSAWMTAKQAMKYISYGGLLYGYADSLRIIKRITIYD